MKIVFLPMSIFFISVFLEKFAYKVHIPGGVFTGFSEVVIEALVVCLLVRITAPLYAILIPLSLAVGDFSYTYLNYFLKLPIVNELACLVYVLPYMLAMICFLIGFQRILSDAFVIERRLRILSNVFSVLILIVTTITILFPSFSGKSPPLSPLFQVLTIIFSVLESFVVGYSIALLLCSASVVAQVGLFGILTMHVSDIAIRYQSVNIELLGLHMHLTPVSD